MSSITSLQPVKMIKKIIQWEYCSKTSLKNVDPSINFCTVTFVQNVKKPVTVGPPVHVI